LKKLTHDNERVLWPHTVGINNDPRNHLTVQVPGITGRSRLHRAATINIFIASHTNT
jgi:Carboxylesterase family